MYIAGEWTTGSREEAVRSPFDGEAVGVVPVADAEDAERAVGAAVEGARAMRRLSAWERSEILRRAADLLETRTEDLARTIASEVGKPLLEARGEAARIPPLLRTSASEGARMHGETVPVDSAANGAGKIAFTLRQPCGVVVAISPFNYPALLVAHKVGPALAAGNAVVLKPARQTPLTALLLTRTLLEAGLPENAIQCVTGPGAELGRVLCADPRVRKISFTGSTAVGEEITRVAGIKRLSLELGANCPLIVLPDADLERVAAATAAGGYVNAGQVCISVQRVLVARDVYGEFVELLEAHGREPPHGASARREHRARPGDLRAGGRARRAGDPRSGRGRGDARHRRRARRGGRGADHPRRRRPVARHLPQGAVRPGRRPDPGGRHRRGDRARERQRLRARRRALHLRPRCALRFAAEVDCGSIQINSSPLWRSDPMPYGGLKGSGIGKEGPRSAVEEMTELKTVVFHRG